MTPRALTMAMLEEIARAHGVTVADIIGRTKPQDGGKLRRARTEAFRRLHEERHLSYPQIGRLVGRRDHTTIIWYLRGSLEDRLAGLRAYNAARKQA